VSELIELKDKFYIFQVTDKQQSRLPELKEVSDTVKEDYKSHLAMQKAKSTAEEYLGKLREGKSWDEFIKENNLTPKTTDFFTRQQPPKGVSDKAGFAKAAFDLPEDQVSEILDLGDGYYLLETVAKQAARIPELAEVEEKVKADLINEKKNEKAKTDAEALLSALKDGGTIEAAGKKFDLTPKSTGFFKRNDPIPNIGLERELSRAAFELS